MNATPTPVTGTIPRMSTDPHREPWAALHDALDALRAANDIADQHARRAAAVDATPIQ